MFYRSLATFRSGAGVRALSWIDIVAADAKFKGCVAARCCRKAVSAAKTGEVHAMAAGVEGCLVTKVASQTKCVSTWRKSERLEVTVGGVMFSVKGRK